MRYPEFIKEKETIGFVAPSFGCVIEPYHTCFQSALHNLQDRGFGTELGPNCYKGDGIGISTDPKACAQELMEYYEKDTNRLLISCGGGELMCTILPYLDFDRIRKAAPKWYLGYSDNTNFTFLLTTLCDVASVYGPCASSFGMEPYHESLTDVLEVLQGKRRQVHHYPYWEKEKSKDEEHPLLPYHCTELSCIRAYVFEREFDEEGIVRSEGTQTSQQGRGNVAWPAGKKGTYRRTERAVMKGRLLGGCLDCLQILTGTAYDRVADFAERYADDGIIWYLEACDLNVFGIRRAMWQLSQAGWFKHVKGFLIGRPLHFGEEMMGLDQYKAVLDVAAEYGVPVIMDADIGHLPPAMPIVNGAPAEVVYEEGRLDIRFDYH